MITQDVVKEIIFAFRADVCRLIKIKDEEIPIIFTNKIISCPQNFLLLAVGIDSKGVVVNLMMAQFLIGNYTPTSLRFMVYSQCWLYDQRNLKGNNNVNLMDAIAFTIAIISIKGILTPKFDLMPSLGIKKDKIIEIVKQYYGITTFFQDISTKYTQGIPASRLIMSKGSEQVYLDMAYNFKSKSTIRMIDPSEKGSKGNPFDNVDEACEFIKRLEDDAYQSDTHMQDYARIPYFYDTNSHQFKVSFSDPYVTFRDNGFPKNAFIVSQLSSYLKGPGELIYPNFCFKPNLYHRKFLYRGQSQDYDHKPCVPNLFRDPDKRYFLDDFIWSQEMELLIQSHPLVQLLGKGVELFHDIFPFKMNYSGLAQHYYNKSSYLDLTSDLGVAKFFATTNYSRENDAYDPVLDEDQLGVIYIYELQPPVAFQKHNGYCLNTIGKQVFMRSGAQHGFLLDMQQGVDFKQLPEVKAFYFRHHPEISQKIYEQSCNGQRFFPTDILELAWKQKMKQNYQHRCISHKTFEYNVQINQKESPSSIRRKLEKDGITIDDTYEPSFSRDQLDSYYNDIKNGWWEEFCKDIYFCGSDGALYKESLLNIPKDPRYKWAFYK